MTAQPDQRVSAQEYFRQDRQSDSKLEFYAGTVVAQAGSTARHNLIAANLIAYLHPQLRRGGCRIFPGDMRVQAIDQIVYTYPDVTVVCGTPQYADPGQMTLLNPTVIFEILSPTTQTRDRTEKLVYYRQIESLQEYILIAQHTPYVQRYTRQTAHFWYVHLTDDLAEHIELPAIGCTLAVADVYDGIGF